ncbi:MAG: M23 family metallopeptidase [Candidatus Latescibacteria bacterium]|nr:M23 family metallopeptidase [Candidatus Latescibacterota bacterium]
MLRLSAISCILLSFIITAHAENYHWPMDAPPALTSTFGEYRGGRLHAAIDLKTYGKEGYPVTAIADGYVWRVRTSPWGYGRVVYVQLDNGLFALWAHLSGFSKRIEKYVQQEQDRRGTYSVNLYFRPDQIPVKRGEIVGYSGSTGIGVPHLHFELRDAKHRPINPLLHGFDIKDTIPPTMQAIGLAPLNADARVKGGHKPVSYRLAYRTKEKVFTHPDTISVWGPIGIGLKAIDRANESRLTNRLAPYRMRLLINGEEIFQKTCGLFGYDVTRHGELAYDFYMSRRGLGRFHSLYRKPGNRLPFYGDYKVGSGVLCAGTKTDNAGHELSPGVHRLQIIAEDVKGNRATAVVFLRVRDTSGTARTFAASKNSPQRNPKITSKISYFPTFAVVHITANQTLSEMPTVRAQLSKQWTRSLAVRQTSSQTYQVVIPFDEKHADNIDVQIETNGQTQNLWITQQTATQDGGEMRSDDGLVRVRFEKEGVYETLFGRIVSESQIKDKRMVGSAVRIMPGDVAFKGAEIAFLHPPDHPNIDKLGIYKWNGKNSWTFVDKGRDSKTGAITGNVRNFGVFALLADTVPPRIASITPANGTVIAQHQPRVAASVWDTSSGIWRDEDIVMKIDGKALIVEYDPEESRIFAKPRKPLTPGAHKLEVIVRDICGNESRRTTAFRIQ